MSHVPLAQQIPWILFVLRNSLTLAWLDRDIGPGFTLRGDLFEAVTDSEITGFYDRLYDSRGCFVGIQISPLAIDDVEAVAADLSYARAVNNGKQLQIFVVDPPADVTETTDQAFGGRIYRSLSGELAFSLDTFFLDDGERVTLATSQGEWVGVIALGE